MALAFGDISQFPANAAEQWVCIGATKLTFATGGTGDSGTVTGMPNVTSTRTAVGIYNLTYPACPDIMIFYSIMIGAATTDIVKGTAVAPTSGTATFHIVNDAGADADSSANDVISILWYSKTRG